MCTDLAAANLYKVDHLKSPEIWKLVEQAKVYYVGGYHLTVSVPAILALAEEAAAKNKVRSILPPIEPESMRAMKMKDSMADPMINRSSSCLSPLRLSRNSSRSLWPKPRHTGTTLLETRPRPSPGRSQMASRLHLSQRLPRPWLSSQRRTPSVSE